MGVASSFTKTLTASSVNNICLVQTTAGAADLILNGAAVVSGVAILDTQRRVSLTSAGNDSAINFTIYGTNDAGKTISETIAGPNANTVSTSQDFKTVTRIAASALVGTNVSAGTTGVGSTPWWPANRHITRFSVACGYQLISGSQTVTVEFTDDEVWPPLYIYQPGWSQTQPVPVATPVTGMSGISANTVAEVTRPCAAFRLTVTAGTGVGKLVLDQAGISN